MVVKERHSLPRSLTSMAIDLEDAWVRGTARKPEFCLE